MVLTSIRASIQLLPLVLLLPFCSAIATQVNLKYSASFRRNGLQLLNDDGYQLDLSLTMSSPQIMRCALDFRYSGLAVLDDRYCGPDSCNSIPCQTALFPGCFNRNNKCQTCDIGCDKVACPFCYFQSYNSQVQVLGTTLITSYPLKTTGDMFQWGSLAVSTTNVYCRVGVFRAVGQSSNFWSNFVDASSPVLSFDFQRDINFWIKNKMYIGGYPYDIKSTLIWTENRLKFSECQSDYYFFIYGLSMCGNNLMRAYGGAYPARISSNDYCLTLPLKMYQQLVSWLPVTCSDTYYCRFKKTPQLDQLSKTVLAFRLTPDGPELKVPLSQLIISDLQGYYLCASYRSPSNSMDAMVASINDYEIVLGSVVLEALYVIYDLQLDRLAFANKLVNETVNTDLWVPDSTCDPPVSCAFPYTYDEATNSCKFNSPCVATLFRRLDDNLDCDLVSLRT